MSDAPPRDDTCRRCGTSDEGVQWWGDKFRKHELRQGRADPGVLCGTCSALHQEARFAAEFALTNS